MLSAIARKSQGFSNSLKLARPFTRTSIVRSNHTSNTTKSATNWKGEAVGIDLGTTNSVVVVLEGVEPRVIENAEGTRTTPSVVAFAEDGQRLVGVAAKRQAVTNPQNTLFSTKRLIGRKFDDPMVQKDLKTLPYKIVRGPNGDAWVEANGKAYSPSEISSLVLGKLKESAENVIGKKVESVVVTVPAYFTEPQRQATKDAGTIAGLDVQRIINEPTAAALAYGIKQAKTSEPRCVAVYDLGGGTFDVSILEISDGVFEVKATNGDTFLGGEDFDNVLVNHLLAEFKRDKGVDLTVDRLAVQRLREAAEKAKVELSTLNATEVNLPFITANTTGPLHMSYKLTRSKFEQLTEHLVERTIQPCKVCVTDSKIKPSAIDEVILVGGMSRMPKVVETVKKIFGKEPYKGVNPDEAVAVGAALQAGVLRGNVSNIVLVDVCPLSLGIETNGAICSKIITKNSNIPIRKSQIFTTAEDGQTQVDIKVLQGERELSRDNKLLGHFTLKDLPPMPRGTTQIEVTFEIDVNGILKVHAIDKGTLKEQRVELKADGGLSKSEIERIAEEAKSHQANDLKLKEAVEAKNRAESIAYDVQKNIKKYDTQLSKEQHEVLKEKIDALRKLIAAEHETANPDAIKDAASDLQSYSMEAFKDIYTQQAEAAKSSEGKQGQGQSS